jgi:hypothetical protein
MIIVLLRNIMGKKCVHSLLIGLLVMLGLSVSAIAQPTVERVSETPVAYVKKPFEVRWEVRWHGASDAYTVLPPEIEDVDWAAVAPGPAEAFVRDGVNVVVQSLRITPNQLGSFEVPEIRVGYLTPGELTPAKQPEEVTGTQEPEAQIQRPHGTVGGSGHQRGWRAAVSGRHGPARGSTAPNCPFGGRDSSGPPWTIGGSARRGRRVA